MDNYLKIPENIIVAVNNNNDEHSFVSYKTDNKRIYSETYFRNNIKEGAVRKDFSNEPIKGIKIIPNKKRNKYKEFKPYNDEGYTSIEDPRGFRFYISNSKLSWIMNFYNYDHENGFDGELVYGWDSTNKNDTGLILVPTCVEDYQYGKSIHKSDKVKLKDCKVGETYKFYNEEEMVYLGYLPVIKNIVEGDYENRKLEISSDNCHCFVNPEHGDNYYKKYTLLYSSKKDLIKVDKEIVKEDKINEYIEKMHKKYWDNEKFEDPNIIRIEPSKYVLKDNEKRIEKFIKYANEPYREWKTQYGSTVNNLQPYFGDVSEYGIVIFNKERTKATKYFVHCECTYDGLEKEDYVRKCIEREAKEKNSFVTWNINPEPYRKEFDKNSKRCVYAYYGYEFNLKNNVIQKTSAERFDRKKTPKIIVTDLIENNKDNIFITKSYLDDFGKCIRFINESGFEFKLNSDCNY